MKQQTGFLLAAGLLAATFACQMLLPPEIPVLAPPASSQPEPPKSSVSESPASEVSSKLLSSKVEVQQPYIETAKAWETIPLEWKNGKSDQTLIYLSVAGNYVDISGRKGIVFDETTIQIGAPGKFDTQFLVYSKYEAAKLCIYEISGPDGAPFFPDEGITPRRGRLVQELQNPLGEYHLKIPCLVDDTGEYLRFGYQYEVVAIEPDGETSFYPIHWSVHDNAQAGLEWVNILPFGNTPAQESGEEKPASQSDVEYISPVTMPEPSIVQNNISYYLLPGSRYYLLHKAGRRDYEEDKTALAEIDPKNSGLPTFEQAVEITWLSNEAVDPSDPTRAVMLGVLGEVDWYWRSGDVQKIYIVLQKSASGFSRWILTQTVADYPGTYFAEMMLSTIGGANNMGAFLTPQPVELLPSDDPLIAQLYFPTTCTTITCHFESYQLAYQVDYNEAFLQQDTSTYIDTSPDGRYELWKINERWMHESTTHSYAVYDTTTGKLDDLGMLEEYFLPSFAGGDQIALLDTVEILPHDSEKYEDYTAWAKVGIRGQIVLYNIQTGERQTLSLDYGDLAWSHIFWSYLWDPYNRRHYLLSMPQLDPGSASTIQNIPLSDVETPNSPWEIGYTLSVFHENGDYLGSYDTQIYQFGAKFVYYLPVMQLQPDGSLLIKNPLSDLGNPYCINPYTQTRTTTFYPPDEYRRADRLLWATDSLYQTASEKITAVFHYWEENGQAGADCFRYFLRQLEAAPYSPAAQSVTLFNRQDTLYLEETGKCWFIKKNQNAQTGALSESIASDYWRSGKLVEWSPAQGIDLLVSYKLEEEKYTISINRWATNENPCLEKLPVTVFQNIMPIIAPKSDSGIQLDAQMFSGLKIYPERDHLTFSYYDTKQGREIPFLCLLYQSEKYQLVYLNQTAETLFAPDFT